MLGAHFTVFGGVDDIITNIGPVDRHASALTSFCRALVHLH